MVRLGNEIFIDDPAKYVGKMRIGLIVNHTSRTSAMVSLLQYCRENTGVRLAAVLAPEHGILGAAQDMEAVGHAALSDGTPVFSLYGSDETTLSPSPEALDLVDALVFDIQDVGSRYYTFLWTMALAMKACARAAKKMIVLDRPNPLNGVAVSGPIQTEKCLSFVGLHPVPVRHGMTAGEMARLLNGHFGIDCDLQVVPMEGWRREMWFDQTGLPWIPPSPNMPSLATATVYPGGCLIEGTTLSEGRGTTTPFELVGAPGIDAEAFAEHMNRLKLPGCVFRPAAFVPGFQKHAGKLCRGIFLHIADRNSFDAFQACCRLIAMAGEMHPRAFAWRETAYEFVTDIPAIDLLFGSDRFRKAVDAGDGLSFDFAEQEKSNRDFLRIRKPFLLY
jgi:uncharacterized protein YbbC (DUF1343 family)